MIVNVTGYEYGRAAREAEEFNPTARKRNMAHPKKIYLVDVTSPSLADPVQLLVRAGSTVSAEKFVRDTMQPKVEARLPSQDELLTAVAAGKAIIDPDNYASRVDDDQQPLPLEVGAP